MENKKKKKDRENRKIIFLLVIFLLLVSVAIIIKFYPQVIPFDQKEIMMYLTVGNYTGIDLNVSALAFGTVVKSSTVKREIAIANSGNNTIRASLSVSGDLSGWTKLSENNFAILSNQNKNITISITVPEDAEFGKYSGRLKISFTR